MNNGAPTKAKQDKIWGLPYTYNDPPFRKSERFCTQIIIRNPKTNKSIYNQTISGMTKDKLWANKARALDAFHRKNWDVVQGLIRSEEYRMTIEEYCHVWKDEILELLRENGSTVKYDFIWNDVLPKFRNLVICDLFTSGAGAEKQVWETIENYYGRSKSKQAITEEERLTWSFLNAVFKLLTEDGFFEANPISSTVRRMTSLESTKAFRALNQRSFSRDQSANYLKKITSEQDETLRTALLLHYMTGMTVEELCGLNIDAYIPESNLIPAHLEILRRYVQKRNNEPELTDLLDSLNCYRKLPCSIMMKALLSSFVRKRKRDGANSDDPLFLYKSTRLDPNTFKTTENMYLNDIFADLPFDKVHSDFIRTNSRMHYLNICKMTESQTAFLLGTDRIVTYGRSYVDWTNPLIMSTMACLLDRWHSQLLSADNWKNNPPAEAHQHIIIGTASNGARMIIRNNHGFILSNINENNERKMQE